MHQFLGQLTPYYSLDTPFVARRSLRVLDVKSASVAHYSLRALETVDFWAWFVQSAHAHKRQHTGVGTRTGVTHTSNAKYFAFRQPWSKSFTFDCAQMRNVLDFDSLD
jgi:hypothetical protein